ncbi:hypothetical protein, partial [Streptomyces sp. NPDC041003]|uniref:hypothetical protein n=1 Tax=Streptomyces sp. NPDC041003 TaxID=3155730 RepID=UPI0033E5207C
MHRSLLLVDLDGFGNRDDLEQAYMRRTLSGILGRVATAAGVGPEARQQADRGDGVMELIDAAVPVADLLRTLLKVVPADLNAVNRLTSDSARIRLRLVLATGSVAVDDHGGWVGAALNDACRLLDADLLRPALRERNDDYALSVSGSVYWGTVRQNHDGIPAKDFYEVNVRTKNGMQQMWLYRPPRAGRPQHGGGPPVGPGAVGTL